MQAAARDDAEVRCRVTRRPQLCHLAAVSRSSTRPSPGLPAQARTSGSNRRGQRGPGIGSAEVRLQIAGMDRWNAGWRTLDTGQLSDRTPDSCLAGHRTAVGSEHGRLPDAK